MAEIIPKLRNAHIVQINGHSPFLETKTYNWETDVICTTLVLYMWVGSRNCGCLVAWFCYQFMAKPGSRTAAVPWPDPYVFTVYMSHRLSLYILYWHTNAALLLVTSYLHIHFSYVHECILTALNCAVFVLLMHLFLWLSLLLLLYIVRNDENKDDQSIDPVVICSVIKPISNTTVSGFFSVYRLERCSREE